MGRVGRFGGVLIIGRGVGIGCRCGVDVRVPASLLQLPELAIYRSLRKMGHAYLKSQSNRTG